MRLKAMKIVFIALAVIIITGLLSVIFLSVQGNKTVPKVTQSQETLTTLNGFIGEAMTVYTFAPYRRYSDDEFQKYFSAEIAEELLENYEHFTRPGEETALEFEEQPYPEIEIIEISQSGGGYAVKLRFGEVFYNYRLAVTPNRIITEITDGGITFD